MIKLFHCNIAVFCFCLLLSSCSTFESLDAEYKLSGHMYSGIKLNGARWYCWSHDCNGEFVPQEIISMGPYLIIDASLSFIADTIAIPYVLTQEKDEGLAPLTPCGDNCDIVKFNGI